MADSVSAFINTVGDKINNQQEEKKQPEQNNQQPLQQPQEEINHQSEPDSIVEEKAKTIQYRAPKNSMTEQKQISLRLPIHVYEQIVEYSQKEYMSMNTFIIRALEKELQNTKEQQ